MRLFRSLLGKPTSKEIEAARIEQEAAEAARRDSIARAEEARLAAEAARPVYSNYYVIMGCYKVPANAQRHKAKLEAKGYEVTELRFKIGYDVVAIHGSETAAKHTDICTSCWREGGSLRYVGISDLYVPARRVAQI